MKTLESASILLDNAEEMINEMIQHKITISEESLYRLKNHITMANIIISEVKQ